jgi:hypothetical protein
MSATHFDLHQFGGRRNRPVKRVHTITTEQAVSYDDYATMQSGTPKARYKFKNGVPSWALDDKKVRAVVCERIQHTRKHSG